MRVFRTGSIKILLVKCQMLVFSPQVCCLIILRKGPYVENVLTTESILSTRRHVVNPPARQNAAESACPPKSDRARLSVRIRPNSEVGRPPKSCRSRISDLGRPPESGRTRIWMAARIRPNHTWTKDKTNNTSKHQKNISNKCIYNNI